MSDQKRANKIREALGKMNPEADALWTEDGLPVLAEVKERTGFEVTREEVTAAAPKFSRKTPDASAPAPAATDPEPKPDEKPAAEKPVEAAPEMTEEEAQAEVDEAYAKVLAAQAAVDKAKDAVVEAEKVHQAAVAKKTAMFPAPNQAQATQAWIKSQQEARAARFGRVNAIMEATGGRPQDVLDPRTPVEKSMARPQGHGHGRPNYNPTGAPGGAKA